MTATANARDVAPTSAASPIAARRRRRLRRSGQASVSTVGRTGTTTSWPPATSMTDGRSGRFAPGMPIR